MYTSCASSPCHNNGSCTNVAFSFECLCPAGYNGDRCENKGNKNLTQSSAYMLCKF